MMASSGAPLAGADRWLDERNQLLRFLVSQSMYMPLDASLDEVRWTDMVVSDVLQQIRSGQDVDLTPFLPAELDEPVLEADGAAVESGLGAPSSSSNKSTAGNQNARVGPDIGLAIEDSLVLPVGQEDVLVVSYQFLLCRTGFLWFPDRAACECILTTIRSSCSVSNRLHASLMRQLLLNEQDDGRYLSTSAIPDQFFVDLESIRRSRTGRPAYFDGAARAPLDHLSHCLPTISWLADLNKRQYDVMPSMPNTTVGDFVQFQMYARLLQACLQSDPENRSPSALAPIAEALSCMRRSDEEHVVAFIYALFCCLRDVQDEEDEEFVNMLLQALSILQVETSVQNSVDLWPWVRHKIMDHVDGQLCNYRASFSRDPENVQKYLELFSLTCTQDVERHVQRMVSLTMSHLFNTIVRTLSSEVEPAPAALKLVYVGSQQQDSDSQSKQPGLSVSRLLEEIDAELQTERQFFEPIFEPFVSISSSHKSQKSSSQLACKALFKNLNAFLASGRGSKLERTVRDLSHMWTLQRTYLRTDERAEELFNILLYDDQIVRFLRAHQQRLADIMQNAIKLDSFDPREQPLRHPTSCAVDFFSAVHQNQLPPLPARYQKMWRKIISSLVQLFATELVRDFTRERGESLLPRPPPLCKFKHRGDKKKGLAQSVAHYFPVEDISMENLLLRLNDLQFAREKYVELLSSIEASMEASERVFDEEDKEIRGLTISTIQDGISSLTCYVGLRVAFGDLSSMLSERLYLTPQYSLADVLRLFDPLMGRICDNTNEKLLDSVIRQVLRSVVRAIRFVLLNGGIQRIFDPVEMVPILMRDILALETFFVADGEGLDREAVLEETKLLREFVLKFFSLDSQVLVDLYMKKMREDPRSTDAAVAFHVLAHRPTSDSVARKFVDDVLSRTKK